MIYYLSEFKRPEGVDIEDSNIFILPKCSEQELFEIQKKVFTCPKQYIKVNDYLGVPQTDFGFRNYNNQNIQKGLRQKYNEWVYDIKEVYEIMRKASFVISNYPTLTIDPKESGPIFHKLTKAVDFEKGLHTDEGSIPKHQAYLDSTILYTLVVPIKKPKEGGELVLITRKGDKFSVDFKEGRPILFNSKIIHSINQFKGERISMVIQFKLVNGEIIPYI